MKVKASRGVVTLQGKVRTEALRQRVENIARSTLGLRELRSSLSIAAQFLGYMLFLFLLPVGEAYPQNR